MSPITVESPTASDAIHRPNSSANSNIKRSPRSTESRQIAIDAELLPASTNAEVSISDSVGKAVDGGRGIVELRMQGRIGDQRGFGGRRQIEGPFAGVGVGGRLRRRRQLCRELDQIGLAFAAGFFEQMKQVSFDGAWRNAERAGDRSLGAAGRDHFEDRPVEGLCADDRLIDRIGHHALNAAPEREHLGGKFGDASQPFRFDADRVLADRPTSGVRITPNIADANENSSQTPARTDSQLFGSRTQS